MSHLRCQPLEQLGVRGTFSRDQRGPNDNLEAGRGKVLLRVTGRFPGNQTCDWLYQSEFSFANVLHHIVGVVFLPMHALRESFIAAASAFRAFKFNGVSSLFPIP